MVQTHRYPNIMMALDRIGARLIAPYIANATVLCLGYPDITASAEQVEELWKVKPRKFTSRGPEHKIGHPLPETLDTLALAGAQRVDCVDSKPSRGCEREVDLNVRQDWPWAYGLVINPGTLEHCFDVATAMFNAWRALAVGGVILHVAPLSMLNHGFYCICPTAFADFAAVNGGVVLHVEARDREWLPVAVERVKRFTTPSECVLYALVKKVTSAPERIPTQWRFSA